jgi:hypothetical protein
MNAPLNWNENTRPAILKAFRRIKILSSEKYRLNAIVKLLEMIAQTVPETVKTSFYIVDDTKVDKDLSDIGTRSGELARAIETGRATARKREQLQILLEGLHHPTIVALSNAPYKMIGGTPCGLKIAWVCGELVCGERMPQGGRSRVRCLPELLNHSSLDDLRKIVVALRLLEKSAESARKKLLRRKKTDKDRESKIKAINKDNNKFWEKQSTSECPRADGPVFAAPRLKPWGRPPDRLVGPVIDSAAIL